MQERLVDLRSDTITLPTPSMRRAMAEAEVGDDVFGEDPTVNRLQEMAAERLGKEAALFVASGTMANLVSELTHCGRGDEMIIGDQAHIFNYEQGGSAAVGGIHTRTVPNRPDGSMLLEDLEAAIRPDNVHFPRTRLIALENTHNRCFGSPLDLGYLRAVHHLARQHGLSVHMDGARLFNAATSLNVEPADLAAEADSVSICLSKALAAPVGSLVCGTRSFIDEARRMRKVLGGGMRQAGVLAAAGIVALSDMTERLAEDHDNARRLADGLAQIQWLDVNPEAVRTNIVYCDIRQNGLPAAELAARLNVQGVRVLPVRKYRIRAVTHYHITRQDIDYVLTVFSREVSAACK
jgi:threonine aldolase